MATSAMGAALSALGNMSESERSQTQSAISSNINVQITDSEAQKQKTGKTAEETLQSLNRDVANANQKLEKQDLTQAQERQEMAQVIGELSQAGINHLVGDKLKEADKKRQEAEAIEKENPAKAAELKAQAQAIEAKYGLGSNLQMGIRAATAALQGLATGNVNQAAVGAVSPYLNKLIKEQTGDNKEANLIAHAVLGAVEAHVTGNNAAAGALGALTAEAAAPLIMQTLYGVEKPENLSDSQKQNVANLSQIAAGLSGGLIGDSTGSFVAGAEIGKRAVENNYLKAKDITSWLSAIDGAKTLEEKQILINKLIQLDDVLQKDAADIKVSYSELIKRSDDLVQLAQSPDCNSYCQEIVKYSIGRLDQIINNYDALASKKRSEGMLNLAIGAGTYGAGRLVISSNTVKTYLGNIPWGDKVVSAGLGMGANTAYQIATNPEDKNVSFKDILWAGSTSFASGGTSFIRMNAINASSAGVKAYTEGENPGVAFTSSVIGSSLGYGVGTGVYYGLNKYHNRNYIFTYDSSKGILWGNAFDSGISEYLSSEGEKVGNELIKDAQ